VTEDKLLRDVIEMAGWLRVTTAHFRPTKTERGWRTAVQGAGKGFPDLVLVTPGGVLWREVKSDIGVLDPDQKRWRDVLLAAGEDWAIWRPSDWSSGRIEAELRAMRRAHV
jgi:hypothetical protein